VEANLIESTNVPGRGAVPLTPAEDQIMGLVAEGYTNSEIAKVRVCSTETVKSHVSHILRKLHVSTRREACRIYSKRSPETGDAQRARATVAFWHSDWRRTMPSRLIKCGSLIAMAVIALMGDQHLASPTSAAGAARPAASCAVKGHMSLQYDPSHPYRIAVARVGPGCKISQSVEELSASAFATISGAQDGIGPRPMVSNSNRVKGRLRTEHAQILMAQVDAYETWYWNGSSVTGYSNGLAQTSVGGCYWHVTDGPFAWWETYYMPYAIYMYGHAYFESCDPLDQGWLEPAAWGDYDGNWGVVCDYEISLPLGSSVQCIPSLVF